MTLKACGSSLDAGPTEMAGAGGTHHHPRRRTNGESAIDVDVAADMQSVGKSGVSERASDPSSLHWIPN